ncbi:oxidoreductase [candidate division TA06 bacterium SM1_40]|uniref:Oxidoreductase n=1 Tax=candidate division TA06 bacterium SM1_40 TaxID=1703773 RepID=A0A0S8JK77_UNCT6|nr:MAG: oxidoreductase [candidate division TA06 bacterium SM1_40]
MGLRIYQVDAFTDKPFKGNPAAVCILPEARDETWMRNVAREMNLSETAFLVRQEDGFDLRWFTPAVEVELCGHATLASAHILWEIGLLGPRERARFHTQSGLLTAERRGDEIELSFPATPPSPTDIPPGLPEAFGITPKSFGKSTYDYLVEVASEEAVRSLAPDFGKLKTLEIRGVMVTSEASSAAYDFVSRFFAPRAGIDEDPVTGSAHCCLGPFWAERLGKNELVGYQASARGGIVRVRVAGDRVHLGGRAVTVLRADLLDA